MANKFATLLKSVMLDGRGSETSGLLAAAIGDGVLHSVCLFQLCYL